MTAPKARRDVRPVGGAVARGSAAARKRAASFPELFMAGLGSLTGTCNLLTNQISIAYPNPALPSSTATARTRSCSSSPATATRARRPPAPPLPPLPALAPLPLPAPPVALVPLALLPLLAQPPARVLRLAQLAATARVLPLAQLAATARPASLAPPVLALHYPYPAGKTSGAP